MMMQPMAMCTEPAPTAPVVCGGETCSAPTGYGNNTCVYSCCATVGGKEVCGAKSTLAMFPTACEPPVTPDPACPDLEAMNMPFEGCCNVAMGKCGFISPVRPGCITMSQAVMLPNPLLACSTGMEDAGM